MFGGEVEQAYEGQGHLAHKPLLGQVASLLINSQWMLSALLK